MAPKTAAEILASGKMVPIRIPRKKAPPNRSLEPSSPPRYNHLLSEFSVDEEAATSSEQDPLVEPLAAQGIVQEDWRRIRLAFEPPVTLESFAESSAMETSDCSIDREVAPTSDVVATSDTFLLYDLFNKN